MRSNQDSNEYKYNQGGSSRVLGEVTTQDNKKTKKLMEQVFNHAEQ